MKWPRTSAKNSSVATEVNPLPEDVAAAGDQTHFAEELPFTAAAPRPSQTLVAVESATAQTHSAPSRQKWLIGVGVVAALLLMVVALSLKRQQQQRVVIVPTASPTTTATAANPELEKRLQQLEGDVGNADPALTPLAFPPVNFTYILQDATVLQQQNRR